MWLAHLRCQRRIFADFHYCNQCCQNIRSFAVGGSKYAWNFLQLQRIFIEANITHKPDVYTRWILNAEVVTLDTFKESEKPLQRDKKYQEPTNSSSTCQRHIASHVVFLVVKDKGFYRMFAAPTHCLCHVFPLFCDLVCKFAKSQVLESLNNMTFIIFLT